MSTRLLRCVLLLPPVTTNHAYRVAGRRVYKVPEMHTYQQDCLLLLHTAEQDQEALAHLRSSRQKIPLMVTMRFYLRTLWRRDLDNLAKLPLDALFAYLQLNDNRVTTLLLEKRRASEAAFLEVEVLMEDEERSHVSTRAS